MSRSTSIGGHLTPNTKTTVFTVPSGVTVHWPLLFLSNHTGNNKWVSAWWYNSSDNEEITIIDQTSVDAKKTLQFGGNGVYVVLEAGDEIRLMCESSSDFCFIITLEYNTKIGATS